MIQARNRGFNEAQYAIIARTDADTVVPTDWIQQIKRNFKEKIYLRFLDQHISMIYLTSLTTVKSPWKHSFLISVFLNKSCVTIVFLDQYGAS